MNGYCKEMLNDSNVTDYKAWSNIYKDYMSVQVKAVHKPKRVYIRGNAWKRICKRNGEEQAMSAADRAELNKDIKRTRSS